MDSEHPKDTKGVNTTLGADPSHSDDEAYNASIRSVLAEAMAKIALFEDELDKAAKVFYATQSKDGGRIGCMMALQAAVDFCDDVYIGQERRYPFLHLFHALNSAENGASDRLFRVVHPPHRPPSTDAEIRQRGFLAAAMEALIRGGYKPDDAAKWVAQWARTMIVARGARVNTPLWKSVKRWREKAMSGNKHQDLDTVAFHTACEAMEQGKGIGQQGAEKMLEMAAAAGTFLENPPT